MNLMLLMMAGVGSRYGADIPKQYIEVNGKPIFTYIVEKYAQMKEIDHIVIVSHEDWIGFVNEWLEKLQVKKVHDVVAGGATRSNSVKNGLRSAGEVLNAESVVLIHDATHPYVDEEGVRQVIDATVRYGGATQAMCQYDTMYRMNAEHFIEEVIPRQEIISGASPEAFKYGQINDIYTNSTDEELAKMTSAGAIALAHGIKMAVIPTELLNLKITFRKDMDAFTKLIDGYYF